MIIISIIIIIIIIMNSHVCPKCMKGDLKGRFPYFYQ